MRRKQSRLLILNTLMPYNWQCHANRMCWNVGRTFIIPFAIQITLCQSIDFSELYELNETLIRFQVLTAVSMKMTLNENWFVGY
jgi:hypothetical protein